MSASATPTIFRIPVQFVAPPERVSMKTAEACEFFGDCSRVTLWRITRKHSVLPNAFGGYWVDDLKMVAAKERKAA